MSSWPYILSIHPDHTTYGILYDAYHSPTISPSCPAGATDGSFAWNATEQVAGHAPFSSALVAATTVTAATTTARDQLFLPGHNGLHSGIYEDPVSFLIETRDTYSNRVQLGPIREVQIIETVGGDVAGAGGRLTGFFTVGYQGATVRVAAQAGIADMQAALQSLPTLGRVEVSTTSCSIDAQASVSVVSGNAMVTGLGRPLTQVFAQGDWIRLADPATGPVYTVLSLDSDHNTLLLSGPYSGPTSAPGVGVPLYYHHKDGYQYIVTFDSNLGDLPALSATGANTLYEVTPLALTTQIYVPTPLSARIYIPT